MNYEKMTDSELLLELEKESKEISLQNVIQSSFKVLNNSAYGALGNAGFIFYDPRIASGITTTGRYIIQHVSYHFEKRVNEKFNTPNKTRLIYNDTDSNFFTFDDIVLKYFPGKTDAQIVGALDKLVEEHLRSFIDEATDEIAQKQNYFTKTIYFKREKICSSGFFMAPKKYALKVYDNEGVRYSEPDYTVVGIEVVRSSTPAIARKALKACVAAVLDKDIERLKALVADAHKTFMSEDIWKISRPSGANNLLQYSDKDKIYSSGCPIAVRAALLYNEQIKKLGLQDKYPLIQEGDKIRYVYLREPNTIKENIIGFVDSIPQEFLLEKYVDRQFQFEKVFLAPIDGIMKSVGWVLEEKSSLDDFF